MASVRIYTPATAEIVKYIDFTAETTDDWSANSAGVDTNETIAGQTWLTNRHANADTFGLVNGAGFQVGTSTTSGGSHISLLLSSLVGSFDPDVDYLIFILTITGADLDNLVSAIMALHSTDQAGAAEDHGIKFFLTGGNYGIVAQSRLSTTTVADTTLRASQASIPTSCRLQWDYFKGTSVCRGDLDAGTTLPALDALTKLDGASRPGHTAANLANQDVLADPFFRLRINPGAGGTITIERLQVYKLRR